MGDRMASVFMRTHYRNRVGTVGRERLLAYDRALRWSPFPRTPRLTAADGRHQLARPVQRDGSLPRVDRRHNVVLVYVTLAAIFFSEPASSSWRSSRRLAAVRCRAVSALPQAQAKGLNVYLLMCVITVAAVLGNSVNYAIGAWLGKKVYRRYDSVDRPGRAQKDA